MPFYYCGGFQRDVSFRSESFRNLFDMTALNERIEILNNLEIKVIRFTNEEVENKLNEIIEEIMENIE